MNRKPLVVIRLTLLLSVACTTWAAWAQEPSDVENMRFVNALRKRGDNDLALAYLERMRKNPSPALAVELDLEIAKTRLAACSVEPDAGKKLATLAEVRQDFQRFLTKYSNHPRSKEVDTDLALITVQQGRVQRNKMLSAEGVESRRSEGKRARDLFLEAEPRLLALSKELKTKLDSLPATPTTAQEKAERLRVVADSQEADLNVALNSFDIASTWHRDDPSLEINQLRGKKFEDAAQALSRVAAGDEKVPATWLAKVWEARAKDESGNPRKARPLIETVVKTPVSPITADAIRIARYFELLGIDEDPLVKDKLKEKETAASRWLKDYPNAGNTPEGCGVRFIEGTVLLTKAAELPKTQTRAKEDYLARARKLFRELELSDNEFTVRARRHKLEIIKELGGFSKKVDDLKSYEDCYVRAQYELSEMNKEITEAKSDNASREARAKHLSTVFQALERGLTLPDAKGKKSTEIGNGRAMLAFYYLNEKRYPEAIRHGETLAREDVSTASSANAATYALQAYGQMIAGLETQLEKTAGTLTDETGKTVDEPTFVSNLKAQQTKMLDFARFVEKFWPREIAGDLARHQEAILLFRQKGTPQEQNELFLQGIQALEAISPSYPGLTQARHLLALRCLQAKEKQLPPPSGQGQFDWRQRGLEVWASIPEPVGADPDTNDTYLKTRELLCSEWYKDQKFQQMNALLTPLLAKLPAMQLSADPAKNKELHEAYVKQLVLLQLYAKYGEAEVAFKANKFADVLKLLNPVVAEIKANKEHPLKTNVPLAQVMLSYALRAAIQENKVEQARDAIKAMQMLTEDGGDASLKLLRQLPVIINKQMEELRKGNDPAKLEQATKNFVGLIDELTKDRKLTPELILTLAHLYAKMDLHPRAIDLLNKFPQPKEGDKEDEKLQHGKQIMLLQELRATKELKPARTLLSEILGTKQKPGWGARNLDVQLENIQLYLAEEDNYNAYTQSTNIVKSLGKGLATADVNKKAAYFEVYYLMVLAQYRFGEKAKEPIKNTKNVNDAAKLIDQLEGRYADFGDEASGRRFKELLEKEPDLKEAYEAIKKNKPAGK